MDELIWLQISATTKKLDGHILHSFALPFRLHRQDSDTFAKQTATNVSFFNSCTPFLSFYCSITVTRHLKL